MRHCLETLGDRLVGLRLLIRRLHTVMEPRFVLITHWNLDFYEIAQLGNQIRRGETKATGVRPGLVSHDGLFVCHASLVASAMPTLSLVFIFLKLGLRAHPVVALRVTGHLVIYKVKGRHIRLHPGPVLQIIRG